MARRSPTPPEDLSTPAGLHLLCHSIKEPVAVVSVSSGEVLERNARFRRLFGTLDRLPPALRKVGDKPRVIRRLVLKSIEGSARITPIPGTFPLQAFVHFSPRHQKVKGPAAAQLQLLLEDRLEQLKNLERLRSLGEVSAILVHEIRTPLSTIRMAVDSAGRGPGLDAMQKRQLDTALEQVDRLDKLLSGIRDFARPYSLTLAEVDAREVVLAALRALQGRLTTAGKIVVDLEPDTGATSILADRDRMIEAVTNLVLNSSEAMPDGGRISIGVVPARRRKGWVEIRIWDEGPGIPADVIGRVFHPFFTTKRAGSGLGLSIVKKIIDLHGGFVSIKSAPGKGTLVMMELPAPRH